MTAANVELQLSPGVSTLNKLNQDGKGLLLFVTQKLGVITLEIKAL